MSSLASVLVGALLGLAALGTYVRLLRRRHRRRLLGTGGSGGGTVAAVGSWLVVGAWIALSRVAGADAVWVAAATFLVTHRLWLRALARALTRGEGAP